MLGRCAATERAAKAVGNARQEATTDRDSLRRRISELAHLASECLLTARPPDLPALAAFSDSSGNLELAPVELNEPAERGVRDAERAVDTARSANDQARDTLSDARKTFHSATAEWRAAVEKWMERLRFHHGTHAIPTIETTADLDDLIGEVVLGQRMGTRSEGWISPAIRHHEGRRA